MKHLSSFIIGLGVASMAFLGLMSTASASYGSQFGFRTDYSYSCDFYRSIRLYKFNGNGFDPYGKKSRCYNSKKHSSDKQAADPRYVYDQFGYNAFGVNQYGRDVFGVCIIGRCKTYHYRSYNAGWGYSSYYGGRRY